MFEATTLQKEISKPEIICVAIIEDERDLCEGLKTILQTAQNSHRIAAAKPVIFFSLPV
jgi:hypothetical protein